MPLVREARINTAAALTGRCGVLTSESPNHLCAAEIADGCLAARTADDRLVKSFERRLNAEFERRQGVRCSNQNGHIATVGIKRNAVSRARLFWDLQ